MALTYQFTSSFASALTFNTASSAIGPGATGLMSLSVFAPNPPSGWYCVGHVGVPYTGLVYAGNLVTAGSALLVQATPDDPTAIAVPTTVNWFGMLNNIWLGLPVAPNGYVSLGVIAGLGDSWNNPPNANSKHTLSSLLSGYACIRQDLVQFVSTQNLQALYSTFGDQTNYNQFGLWTLPVSNAMVPSFGAISAEILQAQTLTVPVQTTTQTTTQTTSSSASSTTVNPVAYNSYSMGGGFVYNSASYNYNSANLPGGNGFTAIGAANLCNLQISFALPVGPVFDLNPFASWA